MLSTPKSSTGFTAAEHLCSDGCEPLPAEQGEADFIKLCDSTFDVVIEHSPRDLKLLKRCLGREDLEQLQVLAEFEQVIRTVEIGDRTALLPFQQGFVICGLLGEMNDMCDTNTYLLTGRLKQCT